MLKIAQKELNMDGKIEWNDSYLIGITVIDNEHKKLLKIANDLYDVAASSQDDKSFMVKFSPVLKSLTDYTEYHFEDEEKLFTRYGYPGAAAHKAAHDNFVKEIKAQIRGLTTATPQTAKRLYQNMVSWVLNHIAKADTVWAKFVKTKM